jgi:hypothetical protein
MTRSFVVSLTLGLVLTMALVQFTSQTGSNHFRKTKHNQFNLLEQVKNFLGNNPTGNLGFLLSGFGGGSQSGGLTTLLGALGGGGGPIGGLTTLSNLVGNNNPTAGITGILGRENQKFFSCQYPSRGQGWNF